ncbi:cell surface protein [Lactiplantibacillus sp. WILCCON 0030]|uniref:Cell surface protein n=1 Tax=Lactiplantibacillus brownii TaxID=3069269 RepID=A0ABU1A6F0_9LACO|nr:cell surface protein [Lactiplantibacillus brownii]MDQ7936529.1 cell surface protein [Lactiplantibacillus brownii]
MYFKRATLLAVLGLTLLSGCGSTKTSAPKTITKHQISYVDHRTKANQDAWSAAKAESQAIAASAKKLREESTTLVKAETEASSQASELAESRQTAKAASEKAVREAAESSTKQAAAQASAASAAEKAAASSTKAASSSAKAASESAASTQTSSAANTTNHANNFSGNTDTAQNGRVVGNSRSKIYHVETQHNYHMSGKNVVYFNSEADAQAAGYRKSMR